jgi:hypothetical protein
VIHLHHVNLPAGLSAFVRRGAKGELDVFVSAALEPARQRAAVRVALGAVRRRGLRAALLPAPLAALFAGGRAWLRPIARALRAHSVASAGAAALAAAAAITVVAAVPHQVHHHGPASAAKPPAISRARTPGPGRTTARARPRSAGRTQPAIAIGAVSPAGQRAANPQTGQPSSASGQPTPTPAASASSNPPPAGASSTPTPTPTPTPAATPSPSPSSSSGGAGGHCLEVLGLWVCL